MTNLETTGLLNHFEINVSNLAASRKFWDWLLLKHLGYQHYQVWEQGISYIKKPYSYLVFVQTDVQKLSAGYRRTHVGLNHLAFSVADKQLITRIKKELGPLNYNELYAARYPYAGGKKHYALYFEDPDRIKVEIVAIGE